MAANVPNHKFIRNNLHVVSINISRHIQHIYHYCLLNRFLILKTLLRLEVDETLIVQSGKPVAVLKTHTHSPRVLIANSNLVPKWATWEHFDKLEAEGLMMYGQMTAGSWIYIGTQGILQGTYETFVAAARKHFNSDNLSGKIVLTSGLGGMGGAQPLSVTMAGGVAICIEIDKKRIKRRIETKYLDKATKDIDVAIKWALSAKNKKKPLSIGLLGNAAEIIPLFVKKNIIHGFFIILTRTTHERVLFLFT